MARVLLCVLFGFMCTLGAEQAAAITLSEKRIVLTPDTPSIDITISSDFAYENEHKFSLINHTMNEDGLITKAAEGDTAPHWAIPYITLEKDAITLAPNEKETIRITADFDALSSQNLSEYRTHFFVRALHAPKSKAKPNTKIDIDMSVGIPVYLVTQEASATIEVKNASIEKNAGEGAGYTVSADVMRGTGNTVYGDLNLYCVDETEQRVSDTPFSTAYGLSIYPEIKMRRIKHIFSSEAYNEEVCKYIDVGFVSEDMKKAYMRIDTGAK